MTKRILTVIMAIGMAFAVLLCGSGCTEKNANYYTLPDVAVGETFEICMDTYFDGGYDVKYEIKPKSGIEFVSREFLYSLSGDGGGNVPMKFIYKATKTGKYEIKFKWKRSWEAEPAVINVYQITVTK